MASVVRHAYLLAPATIMTNHEATSTASAADPAKPEGWALVIGAPSSSRRDIGGSIAPTGGTPWFARRLLGLPIVLRLALTAQAAGARSIFLAPCAERAAMKSALRDDRLKIPVSDAELSGIGGISTPPVALSIPPAPSSIPPRAEVKRPAVVIRVPANLVVHRAVLGAVARSVEDETASSGASASRPSILFAERVSQVPPSSEMEAAVVFVPGESEKGPIWQAARDASGPYGFSPIAVTQTTGFAAAERALLRALRKPQDGWTSTRLNRPLSLAITRRLVGTSLRPNQVSVAILGVGLLGAYLASRGTYASLVAGATLFHAQSVLDGCDGEMSRLTFRGSHTGEWLDTVGDDLTNYGFFGGAAWGLYATTGQAMYLAVGALTVLCGVVGSGLEYRYLIKIGSGDLLKYPLGIGKAPGPEMAPESKSSVAKMFDAVAPLFKRDTFVFLTFLGALAGAVGPLLAVFALGAVGVLIAVLKAELRMARERRGRAVALADSSPSLVDPVVPRD
jgi:phosphatidylglycerophosphate synthase